MIEKLTHRVYHIAPNGITGRDTVYKSAPTTQAAATAKARDIKSNYPTLKVMAGLSHKSYTVNDISCMGLGDSWITLLKNFFCILYNKLQVLRS